MLLFTPQNRALAARLLAGKVNSASEGASPKANLNATGWLQFAGLRPVNCNQPATFAQSADFGLLTANLATYIMFFSVLSDIFYADSGE